MRASARRNYLALFLTFLKIGAFTFGGGYAMISLIQREAAEKKKWITQNDILDIVAIAESTPGPIAINAATFVGYKTAGFFGAFFATFGMILPSFLIISALSLVLRQFSELTAVRYAFMGVKAGVLALIVKALVGLFRQCPKTAFSYCVMAFAFLLPVFFSVNVLFVIAACALAGLIFTLVSDRRTKA